MLTRNTRRKIRNGLIGALGCSLVKLWIRTLRVRLEGFCFDGKVALPPESGIYVCWHQRLFTPAAFFRKSGFRVMVSEHSDGEMIARILQGLGMSPVRGSTTRGGVKAVRELLREDVDRSRLFMVIAADGPKGPPRRLQAGAIFLASKTGLPIYACAITVKSFWRAPSWDGFVVPKPRSKAVIRAPAEPVHVPPDLDKHGIEENRLRMEKVLEELTCETDEHFDEIYARAKPRRRLPRFEERKLTGSPTFSKSLRS